MKLFSSSLEKTGMRAGLITATALVAFFLIMRQSGLAYVLSFRFLNAIILGTGIVYALNKFKNELSADEIYLKGLAMGIYTSAVATVTFGFFMSIFLSYFDTGLMQYIKSTVNFREYINGLSVFLIIFLEGMASGLIITFCAMQYFKSTATKTSRQ